MLDDRQRLSASNLITRVRRSTTNLDVVELCDLAEKLLPLTRVTVTPVTENATLSSPVTLERLIPVTDPPPKKARGRPRTGRATTAAERMRKHRANKKAAANPPV